MLAAAFSLLLFYYLPSNLSAFLSSRGASLSAVPQALPTLGLAIAALVFLGLLLRGTAAYGFILIMLGLLFTAYVYVFFNGGRIGVQLQAGGAAGEVAIDASTLMYILLVAPVLTVAKGVFIVATRREGSSAGGAG